ncbi:MAG: tRNA 2-thiouridine(34) synthase MnmA [Candidatus Marinimicrobia bacterium]|nr:tRNA 2-thiouridine(34) synthase MnmA [Candidatus Neomarinimicrobiota bacterium]
MKKQKVAVAMSGGVDSGVAAALIVKAGYETAAFHMHLWSEELKDKIFVNKCCNTESLETARKTAEQLNIPFFKVDFLEEIFKKRVVDYFLKEYGLGKTPNPCMVCNRFIKFGELMDYARTLGYDYLATGHHARVKKDKNFHLLMGKDKKKDQSYFLYSLNQKKLSQVVFPVGGYQKTAVIKMAKKWKLPVAERPESQEICFYPEDDYRPFLKRQIKEKIIPGEVVNPQGKVIGKHQGLPLYTIGQRHGFRITDKGVIGPLYVIDKKVKKNQLVVGFGEEAEKKEFKVKEVSWVSGERPKKEIRCRVRIRHQGELLECRLKGAKVVLGESERGVAPGQAAVFYQGEEVLGGGIIRLDND